MLLGSSADKEEYATVSFKTSCELGTREDTTQEKSASNTKLESEEDLSLSTRSCGGLSGVVVGLLGSQSRGNLREKNGD